MDYMWLLVVGPIGVERAELPLSSPRSDVIDATGVTGATRVAILNREPIATWTRRPDTAWDEASMSGTVAAVGYPGCR